MVVALVFLEMMVSSSWVTLTFLLKINKRSKWETLSQSSLPESQSLSLLSSAWCSSCSWKSAYLKIVVSFPQQAPAEPWVYKLGIYWLLHGWQTLSKAHAIFMGSCWPFQLPEALRHFSRAWLSNWQPTTLRFLWGQFLTLLAQPPYPHRLCQRLANFHAAVPTRASEPKAKYPDTYLHSAVAGKRELEVSEPLTETFRSARRIETDGPWPLENESGT